MNAGTTPQANRSRYYIRDDQPTTYLADGSTRSPNTLIRSTLASRPGGCSYQTTRKPWPLVVIGSCIAALWAGLRDTARVAVLLAKNGRRGRADTGPRSRFAGPN